MSITHLDQLCSFCKGLNSIYQKRLHLQKLISFFTSASLNQSRSSGRFSPKIGVIRALSRRLPSPAPPHVGDKGNPDACVCFRAVGRHTERLPPHKNVFLFRIRYSTAARGWAVIQTPVQPPFVFYSGLWSTLLLLFFKVATFNNALDTKLVSRLLQLSCRFSATERRADGRFRRWNAWQTRWFPATILQSWPRPPSLPHLAPSLQTRPVDQLRCRADKRPRVFCGTTVGRRVGTK